MKNLKLILLASTVSVFILSCSTEGPVGPQGPQGNANVASTTFDVNPNVWASGTNDDWIASFTDGDITNDVATSGAVQVFEEVGPQNVALPYTEYLSGYSESWTYGFSPGNIAIDLSASITNLTAPTNYITFVVVALTADGIYKAKHNGYNLTSEQDMMKLVDQKLAKAMIITKTQTGEVVGTKLN